MTNELAKVSSVLGSGDVKIKLNYEVVKYALNDLKDEAQLLEVLRNLDNFININRFEKSSILDKIMQNLSLSSH